MKFSEKEIEILGKPVTDAEFDEIAKLSDTWDESKKLQAKYPNFYDYLAQSLREKEGRS